MKIVIDIPESIYEIIKEEEVGNSVYKAIKNGTPYETVTEFADRCRECGAKHGRDLVGDTISRQMVLESIKNLYPDMPVMDIMDARRKWLEKYAPYFECENVVEHLPSVNPQPETAHWITTRTLMHDGEYYCDKCDCDAPNNKKWDYCPNCGRRMVCGPQQESEG